MVALHTDMPLGRAVTITSKEQAGVFSRTEAVTETMSGDPLKGCAFVSCGIIIRASEGG